VADFLDADLRGARFERADLTGAQLADVTLAGSRFRGVDLTGAVLRGVQLADADIDGEIGNLKINGVDVGPLVEAELDRRDPERITMRPTGPSGFQAAWDVLERRWAATVARARQLPGGLLDESVDGEWSFIQTLRHLLFASDVWVRRVILGDPAPWHPLGLPWDEMPPTPGIPRDRDARPALQTVLELRRDRMSMVREVMGGLTETSLDGSRTVTGPGWPEPGNYRVRDCLLVVLDEEWRHRLFAERDLDVLAARLPS
jgi:DinB superfamily/Pentapeptide repeats (8 copies)